MLVLVLLLLALFFYEQRSSICVGLGFKWLVCENAAFWVVIGGSGDGLDDIAWTADYWPSLFACAHHHRHIDRGEHCRI